LSFRPFAEKGHTMELKPPGETGREYEQPKPVSWKRLLLAVVAAFILGTAVRVVLEVPEIRDGLRGLYADYGTIQLAAGVDIAEDVGRKIRFPMHVQQVLPFMIRDSKPRYIVFGGYILAADGSPDKTRPVMAVAPYMEKYGATRSGSKLWISGLVALSENPTRRAESALTADQVNDLQYITERVGFWDRVVVWASAVAAYTAGAGN